MTLPLCAVTFIYAGIKSNSTASAGWYIIEMIEIYIFVCMFGDGTFKLSL